VIRLSPLGTAATNGLSYYPRLIDGGNCGAIGGMKFGKGSRITRRKPAPAPPYPPQILHDQSRARPKLRHNLLYKPVLTEVVCMSYINIILYNKVTTLLMALVGRCLDEGTHILNYGATKAAPTQEDQPFFSSKRRPHFQTHEWSWKAQKIWLCVPPVPENKNDCAGEGQRPLAVMICSSQIA
jgi:hypothetical protein